MQRSSLSLCGDPDRPVLGGDRRQLVEAAELAERPLGGAEQIAHHVLDRPGEQDRDRRGVLQDRAQLAGDRVRVAVGLAWRGELLELVQEQDQPLAIGGGDPLQQLERVPERAIRRHVADGG